MKSDTWKGLSRAQGAANYCLWSRHLFCRAPKLRLAFFNLGGKLKEYLMTRESVTNSFRVHKLGLIRTQGYFLVGLGDLSPLSHRSPICLGTVWTAPGWVVMGSLRIPVGGLGF